MDWTPVVTTSTVTAALIAGVLWLARNLIVTRLKKSVGHEFNVKLEAVKADLRAKEADIETLRSGAMSAMASRQMAVDKRRLDAVDQLWSTATAYAPARFISRMLMSVKFDVAVEIAKHDARVRETFEAMGLGFDPKKMDLSGASKARPYVSQMAWATYLAFASICNHALMRWNALRTGTTDLSDDEAINNLIKAALPHHEKFVDEHGPDGYPFLLDRLETNLLQELQAVLAGQDDKTAIDKSAEILKYAAEVQTQLDKQRIDEIVEPEGLADDAGGAR